MPEQLRGAAALAGRLKNKCISRSRAALLLSSLLPSSKNTDKQQQQQPTVSQHPELCFTDWQRWCPTEKLGNFFSSLARSQRKDRTGARSLTRIRWITRYKLPSERRSSVRAPEGRKEGFAMQARSAPDERKNDRRRLDASTASKFGPKLTAAAARTVPYRTCLHQLVVTAVYISF